MKRLIQISLLLIALFSTARSGILLSEILANEPGRRVLLEWLEVFNNGTDTVDLYSCYFIVGDDTLSPPENSPIAPFTYAVLCRRLEPRDGSDCFEYFWGDSSGTWGDSPSEDYPAYELGMSLSNSSGSIYLLDSTFTGLDDYSWDHSADDARSVERDDVTDPFSGWHDCYNEEGFTPGRPNSEKPSEEKNYFLEILPKTVRLSDTNSAINITYATPSGTEVNFYIYDDSSLKCATLMEEGESFGQFSWNLSDDNSRRLPPGLYFILFRTSGELSVNKTLPVVISP